MLRHLQTLNDQCGRMLLRDCAHSHAEGVRHRPRWIVSLAKLALVAPEFVSPEPPADGPRMGYFVERHGRSAAMQVGRDDAA